MFTHRKSIPWPRAGRGGSALAVALLLLCSLPAGAEPRPVGRLVWTEVDDSDSMALYQRVLYPPASVIPKPKDQPPGELCTSGGGSPEIYWASHDATADQTAGKTDRQQGPATDKPRMHTALDNIGVGFMAGFGKGIEVTDLGGSKGKGELRKIEGSISQAVPDREPSVLFIKPFETAGTGVSSKAGFFPSMSLFNLEQPDGSVLYRFAAYNIATFQPGKGIVWSLIISGKQQGTQPYIDLGKEGMYPALSPDGSHIAYVTRVPGALATQLMLAKLNDARTAVDGNPKVILRTDQDMMDRRFCHPVWRWDQKALVFASDVQGDPTKESWSIYGLSNPLTRPEVDPTAVGLTSASVATELVAITTDGDCVWPAFSGDGRYVAYSRSESGGKYALYTVDVNESLSPGTAEKVSTDDNQDCMWATWWQDLFSPSMLIELSPQDTTARTTVTVTVKDDVANLKMRPVTLVATGMHFKEKFDSKFNGSTPPGSATFSMNAVADSGGMNFRTYLVGTGTYSNPQGEIRGLDQQDGATLGEHKQLTGFYANKDARITVKVIGRDNQYCRGYLKPTGDPKDDLPYKINPGDPGAVYPSYQSPYMLMKDRQSVMAGGPGVSWWFEGDDFGVLPGSVNQPEFVFRFSNYQPGKQNDKPLFFHAVAKDLWGNTTEVVIPVWIWGTHVDFSHLGTQSQGSSGKQEEPR